jgi:hypothetical protein
MKRELHTNCLSCGVPFRRPRLRPDLCVTCKAWTAHRAAIRAAVRALRRRS